MPASRTSDRWRPEVDLWHPSVADAAEACSQFVAEIAAGGRPRWLTISGPYGCGKTFLARHTFIAAAKWCKERTADYVQPSGIYHEKTRRPMFRMLDEARFAQLLLDDRQYDLPEYLAHEWLVCFDDLGSKRDGKEVLADALLRLANQRLDKWTLWTTNLNLQELSNRIDGRVASRLIRDANRIVTITAGDYATRRPTK